MKRISPNVIVGAMKVLFAALALLAEEISRQLIKERLIPEQLQVIGVGAVGSLFILIALLWVLVFWKSMDRYLKPSLIITGVALILITFIQINYVVTANVGQPATPEGPAPEHQFLIGYSLTEAGTNDRIEDCGPNLDEKSYIECAGWTEIPFWYGRSYTMMAIAYAFLYLVFAAGVVLTLGGILKRAGTAAVEKLAGRAG